MKAPRHNINGVADEIRASADRALDQAFAMHEAAIVLACAEAFDKWANEHPGMYGRVDVVTWLMAYGRKLVDEVRPSVPSREPD